jgi:hypothetical protein
MEEALAVFIRTARELGWPIPCYMLELEGENLLYAHYGETEATKGFKFSDSWRTGFQKRHGFSIRKCNNAKTQFRTQDKFLSSIKNGHCRFRNLQLSEINDPVYGFAHPYAVYNRDQVPIALAKQTCTTLGAEVVWDVTRDESDMKRFCTLNLTIPMRGMPNGENFPRPHLVFKGSKFCRGEDWTGVDKAGEVRERDLWDKDVAVSMQECAWVDEPTNIYWPVDRSLIIPG